MTPLTRYARARATPNRPQAKIGSVPTFISFVDGKQTAQFSGASVEKLEAAAAALAVRS